MKTKALLPFMLALTAIVLLGCPTPITPPTDTMVNLSAIPGVTAPVAGATPVTTISDTDQYTGTVTWSGTPTTFAYSTSYTATITLTAKTGYTLSGVTANFFTVTGASSVANTASSGTVTAVFPSTAAEPDTVINIAAIAGVTAPVAGATPVTTISDTDQYTGTVTWSGSPTSFAASTVYTATITLTAKTGYTLTGVAANFFTVAGATSVTNSASTGTVTAVFPATAAVPDTVISIAAIPGVTAPATGATPVTAITETDQYTGTVTWSPAVSNMFVSNTVYTATITLTAKAGFTLTGVTTDFFTVAGTTSDTNPANSGVVTAVFPTTTANLAAVSDYTGTGVGTLKAVQGGTFNNGTADMTVSSFRMSQHEITMEQFVAVTGLANPSSDFTSVVNGPVQCVNWYHALVFCNKLSEAEGLTPVYSISGTTNTASWGAIPTTSDDTWNGAVADWSANGYRLPTEAEWQFAARGGNSSNNYTYAGSNTIDEVTWYTSNSSKTTHTVGTKEANELGLYDMCGNVWEWCWDWFDGYPGTAQTDYRGPLRARSASCAVAVGSPLRLTAPSLPGTATLRKTSTARLGSGLSAPEFVGRWASCPATLGSFCKGQNCCTYKRASVRAGSRASRHSVTGGVKPKGAEGIVVLRT